MNNRRKPTAEQIAALQRFAKAHGRRWKDELSMTYWYNARIWRDYAAAPEHRNDGTVLHGIRNEFGPTWLMNYRLPKGE